MSLNSRDHFAFHLQCHHHHHHCVSRDEGSIYPLQVKYTGVVSYVRLELEKMREKALSVLRYATIPEMNKSSIYYQS